MRIRAREARCEDWRDPARRLGCPNCGVWLERNDRLRVRWPLLMLAALVAIAAAAAPMALGFPHEAREWSWLTIVLDVPIIAMVGTVIALRYGVRRVGPPLVPVDAARSRPES